MKNNGSCLCGKVKFVVNKDLQTIYTIVTVVYVENKVVQKKIQRHW